MLWRVESLPRVFSLVHGACSVKAKCTVLDLGWTIQKIRIPDQLVVDTARLVGTCS